MMPLNDISINQDKKLPHPQSLSPRERGVKPISLGESEARGQGGGEGNGALKNIYHVFWHAQYFNFLLRNAHSAQY
jgi:hypothetical protein